MRILVDNYDCFYDRATRVQFDSHLDLRTGLHVGIAVVADKAAAAALLARPNFHEVNDHDWQEMSVPASVRAPKPAVSSSGDPLTDQKADVDPDLSVSRDHLEGAPAPPGTGTSRTGDRIEDSPPEHRRGPGRPRSKPDSGG